MSDTTGIGWCDSTWPALTVVPYTDATGRQRECTYVRKRTDRPGTKERREKRAEGLAWCRGCQAWLPAADVRQGACRPHLNAEYRAKYAADGEAIRQRVHARKRGLDQIPSWWRDEQFAQFGGLCAYGCGRAADTLDHVWPVVHGGQSEPSNLVPACHQCNSSKRDRNPAPWLDRFAAAFPEQYEELAALARVHASSLDLDLLSEVA